MVQTEQTKTVSWCIAFQAFAQSAPKPPVPKKKFAIGAVTSWPGWPVDDVNLYNFIHQIWFLSAQNMGWSTKHEYVDDVVDISW
jgi:hypothetical protein